MGEGNGDPLQYSCLENPMGGGAWWATVHGVAKSRTRLSNFTFTFHFHALEKEMATHSSVLAWRIPGMGEPGGLLSMGSHRVRHDWSDLAAATLCHKHTHTCVHACIHTHVPTLKAVFYMVPQLYVVPLDQNTLSSTHCLVKSHSLRFELGDIPPLKTGLSNLHMCPPPTSSLSNRLAQHFICACGTVFFSKWIFFLSFP